MAHKNKHASPPILTLPEPCHVKWDTMHQQHPEAQRRYCDSCDKHVHDLSSMTKTEAMALLEAKDWDICVNYEVNEAGEMLFRPEPPTRFELQLQGVQKLLAAAALITPLALTQAACEEEPLRLSGEPYPVAHSVETKEPVEATPSQGGGLAPNIKGASGEEAEIACDGEKETITTTPPKQTEPHTRHGGEAKPVDLVEDEDLPRAVPHQQRLGGAPRAVKPEYDTSPAPSAKTLTQVPETKKEEKNP